MTHRLFRISLAVLVSALAAACTMKKQEAPPLTGPSEYGLSVTLSASPDILAQDGASQSLVTVRAMDTAGQPVTNLSLRAEIMVNFLPVDYGSLSARNIVTDANGRATLVYTAPPGSATAVDTGTVVTISATPIGNDFLNSAQRSVSIRLVPPGIVIPPDGMRPKFTISPDAPADNQMVLFDATSSESGANAIAEYKWSFGDGDEAFGPLVSHSYGRPGTYVATLTVSDSYGRSASTSKSIDVGQGILPTASFTFSPTEPLAGVRLNFNGSGSTAAPGRQLVSYRWDFGDGTSGSGVQTSHTYATAGIYTVTLVVTDDVGRTANRSAEVEIRTDSPLADFTFSPTAPAAGSSINFSGSASSAVAGRTITTYLWSFGDGTTASGVSPVKTYAVPGSYNVTLTVTDSAGKTATVTKSVSVS